MRSLIKLSNSISVWNCGILPPNSGEDQKKVFAAFWFYLKAEFRIMYLPWVSSGTTWALLAKKPRGPDIFRSHQCQTRGGMPPCLTEIDARGCDSILYL